MSNEFLPFATAPGAPVDSQAAYAAYAVNGRGPGIVPKESYNKSLRQGSVMAYVLGQIVSDSGGSAFDNGDLASLVAAVKLAFGKLTTWQTITGTAPGVATFPNNAGYITAATTGVGAGWFDVNPSGGYGGVGAVVSGSNFLTPQPGSWQILTAANAAGDVFYWLKRVA